VRKSARFANLGVKSKLLLPFSPFARRKRFAGISRLKRGFYTFFSPPPLSIFYSEFSPFGARGGWRRSF
jgi:hypothetical protein